MVEEFHNGIAKILGEEIRRSVKEVREQLFRVDEEIQSIDLKMAKVLASVDKPSLIVDRVVELSSSFHKARDENAYYDAEVEIRAAAGQAKENLSVVKKRVINSIQSKINAGLRKTIYLIFGPKRKSPEIEITETSYSYKVSEDTGTGTAYMGMLMLDLTIFRRTILPVIAHDSLLFKNIENDSVANLFQIYADISKQSFVAIDEIDKYGKEAAALLRGKKVIQLSNADVLYIKDWRVKTNTNNQQV